MLINIVYKYLKNFICVENDSKNSEVFQVLTMATITFFFEKLLTSFDEKSFGIIHYSTLKPIY